MFFASIRFSTIGPVYCCVAVWIPWILRGEFGEGRCPWSAKALCSLNADYLSDKYNENSNKNGMKLLELNKFVTVMMENKRF